MSDLVYAFRRITRAPAFTATAVATLALGIGANAAIFSVVKAVLLQPLPYRDADRLVMVWGKMDKGAVTMLSGPEVRDYSAATRTFANVGVYSDTAANLTGGQDPERVVAAQVSPNLFATLGVRPALGRAFAPSDDPQALANQVVLGFNLWRRRFGGNPEVVGQRILVDGAQVQVLGVMPAGFTLPLDLGNDRPSELWQPLDLRAPEWNGWGNHSLVGVARLRDAVSPAQATMTLRGLEDQWIQDRVGGGWNDSDIVRRAAVPIKDLVLGDVRTGLWLVFGAVAAVLLIACANVANLSLARSDERQREIAVRTAIGASRARIVRQLLIESSLLSALGGAAGVGVALAGLRALTALNPQGIPRVHEAQIDSAVLLVTALLTVVTGVLFGLAPAIELGRADVTTPLRESGRGSTGSGSQRFRDALTMGQMALSIVLLIGAVLLLRTFIELRRIDLGFNPQNALTLRLTLPLGAYERDADAIRIVETLRRRFAELHDVASVGATRLLPLTGTIGDWSITLEGREKRPGENPNGDWQVVTPGYFESMGIRLIRGRFLAETDTENAPIVAVISETMANRYWPSMDAIGQRFSVTNRVPYHWITVVGVVGAVHHNVVTEAPRAEMYVPHAQWGAAGASTRRAMTFVLRTARDPTAVLPDVRAVVRSIDPNLPLSDVQPLDRVAAEALGPARFATWLFAIFAALALCLATIGVYGVLSLLITRRRYEFGIRLALGARPLSIVEMVMTKGLTLVAIGMACGLAAAAALTRVMQSLLYGVTPFDPVTFTVVPTVLGTVALLACVIPAGRAARLDPMITLRDR